MVRERFYVTIAAMEPAIRADVRADADGCGQRRRARRRRDARRGRSRCTISRLLGLPLEDEPAPRCGLRAAIANWLHRLPAAARRAAESLRTYFADHVERRRRAGGDDLLADVVAAQRRGALTCDEIPGLCLLLYIAGTETVADFIGNALVALAEHPEQRALLTAEPQRSAAAVERCRASSRWCSTRCAQASRRPSCTESSSRPEAPSRCCGRRQPRRAPLERPD